MNTIRNALAAALSGLAAASTWLAGKVRPPVTTQGGGGHGEE